MKSFLVLTMMALNSMSIFAYNFVVDGIYYDIISNPSRTVEVTFKNTDYNSYSGNIIIPQSVVYNEKTWSVRSVRTNAFRDCNSLTSVTIPNSVTSIGNDAFYNCSNLTSVILGSNAIVSVARTYDKSMKSIFGEQVKTYVIGNAVEIIGDYAFYGCWNLTSVTIPNSVTSIGSHAFRDCSSLISITIPESVTSIGSFAFGSCLSLTSISIPESVTSIGSSAFISCSGLTSVIIPDGVTIINENTFNGCSSLNTINIGRNVMNIGNRAFYACNSLTSVVINSKTIASYTGNTTSNFSTIFGSQVTEYVFGDNVKSIGAYVCYSCSNLTNVIISNSVTSIGNYAFSGCSGLAAVTIPNSLTNIGNYAFKNCSGLTSITIPESVTSIGIDAFDGTTWYNNQPDGMIYVDKIAYKFKGTMPSGSHITIKEGTHIIAGGAFSGCDKLLNLTIPNSITNIGEQAFRNCAKLKSIFVSSQIPPDCDGIETFSCNTGVRDKYDVYNYAVLHVPMGSKEEYAAAYEWRYFAKIKEDLDINGQVFYTTLSVNQAGDGYVKHYVKADEPYTLYIGSELGMRINTVMFNGEDVTDQLIDGYYTTPNITRPSKIVVSYEQDPDGIASVPADDNLHVYGNDGSLFVSGIEEPQGMSVYTLNGTLVSTQTLEGDAKIKLNEGVYIIKVGDRTFKVSL